MSEIKNSRRLRFVPITPEFLIELLKSEEPVTVSFAGMPLDAEFRHFYFDSNYQLLMLLVESESFDPVPSGAQIPEFRLTMTMHPPPEQKGDTHAND